MNDPERFLADAGIVMPPGRPPKRCRCRLPKVMLDETTRMAYQTWDRCGGLAEPESPVCAECARNHWNPDGTPSLPGYLLAPADEEN